ncbi:MAG: dTDP-L-rhamnose 4-epimerase [Firmicutes bacterium ADurb.Bin456]|nr:MAG: dTDP-L-rhamnose 4-epimerase [Firmicutes bacterium ADurb.Bin456]
MRYFNVFGPRQDPDGAYAAVIPRWFSALLREKPVYIFGDGETSRDFCYIKNVIQANLLAASTTNPDAAGQVYNVAVGQCTSLNELFYAIRNLVAARYPAAASLKPIYRDFRPGDVRHSLADISRARKFLGYVPLYPVHKGLNESLDWYVQRLGKKL